MKIIGQSPMIKFWMSCVLWLGFLFLYLQVLYRELKPVNSGSWATIYILLAWYFMFVLDEVSHGEVLYPNADRFNNKT